jgi:hypothetical protein
MNILLAPTLLRIWALLGLSLGITLVISFQIFATRVSCQIEAENTICNSYCPAINCNRCVNISTSLVINCCVYSCEKYTSINNNSPHSTFVLAAPVFVFFVLTIIWSGLIFILSFFPAFRSYRDEPITY